MHEQATRQPRPNLKDIWNAYMVEDMDPSMWSPNDIPFCPTTAPFPPKAVISYPEAQAMFEKRMREGEKEFYVDAFIHFCIDDQRFDGVFNSVWNNPEKAFRIGKHFAGFITADFSTYADFPDSLKRWNTYRMRAFGYYAGRRGFAIINNVRWGTLTTWEYCFDGIPQGSMVFIGTVASDIRKSDNRPMFEGGFMKMLDVLKPSIIIVYGSARNHSFDIARERGIKVIVFPSRKALAFKEAGDVE